MECCVENEHKTYTFKSEGTCAKAFDVKLNGDIIEEVCFYGGCPGNLLGISKLIKGMSKDEVVSTFKGTPCGRRETSCPDQLAKALESIE